MRKYYYSKNKSAFEQVGAVDNGTVSVSTADWDISNLVYGTEVQFSAHFFCLGRAGVNASISINVDKEFGGGFLVIIDYENLPSVCQTFVYHHEVGHIMLGHEMPNDAAISLANEIAADAVAAAAVDAASTAAFAAWLRGLVEGDTLHALPISEEARTTAYAQFNARALALEKRVAV